MNTFSRTEPDVNTEDRRALLAERLRQAAQGTADTPLSFAQHRLWFLDQLEPNSPLYNVPTVVQMSGRLDADALQRSLDQMVRRHEILRTRFTSVDGTPTQVVDPSVDVTMAFHDLTRKVNGEAEAEARRLVRAEVNRPFNLSAGPLLRAALIRFSPQEHWFVLNLHHIVSDEWSLKVCFRELTAMYGAAVSGGAAELPELPIQYADYAVWQRDWMKNGVVAQQTAYWRDRLEGDPPVLELPADFARPAVPGFRGAGRSRELAADLRGAVNNLAARNGATAFMVLLAAFKTLLHRWTRTDDVVIGSPIAGRTRLETEELIGFFVNTLMLRTDLSGNPTFEDLLRRVRETTLGAFAHQDLPFEKLVEELRPERTLNHMPFARVMFAVQNSALDEMRWPGLTLRFLDVECETSKFDLTFVVQEMERGLVIRTEYNRELFRGETIARLLENFETLLRSAVTAPERRLSELNILEEPERRRVLSDWNATGTAFPRGKTLAELFEAQVERAPNAVAVVYWDETMTWRELNARSNQLARHLQRFGVGPDVPVGLCMQRSADMIVAMLAVLKAGGAYVPLDPAYPKPRLGYMAEDSKTPVILTQQKLLSRVPRNSARIICLDSDWELISREMRENLPAASSAENLAYIIYTSGSTGQPKGVPVPQRAVSRLVLNTDYVEIGPEDRIAQASNASFDAATFEIWGALLNGAQLVGIQKEVMLSPKDFARELREKGVSVLFLTTALFNQMAAEMPSGFSTLRVVLFGGEAVEPRWVRAVLKESPPQKLLHVYGPTENTTFSTWHEVRHVPDDAVTIPIGRPIANTTCYVLDEHMNPVPVGIPGELYLGGDGLAPGYLNRPELTRQKFVPNPFSANGGQLYRSGDLVRWLPDGAIEFIGRIDQQVKIRGFRVELGEIETVLNKHSGVRECAVVMRENGSANKKLIAYFVPDGEPAPSVPELRKFLKDRLPDYMVPSLVIPLRGLPLTPNGKVDRNALPQPDRARPEQERHYASPRDGVELELTRIFESVLGVQPVGIEDKFFDLGGHSLIATRVIARIEKSFGRKLRLATIFQAQTIEQLAAILRKEIQEENAVASTSVVEIQPKGLRPPIFFVHGAGGGMFWGYVNLSRHLGHDQPVYGLRSRGLDGGEEFPTIEKMAAQYIEDIRAVQPRGPYHLGGYCFGGNIAYEMARQLREQGETVETLALFNCAPPQYCEIRPTPLWAVRFVRNLFYWAKYFLGWTPPQRREFFRWKREMLRRKTERFFGRKAAATVDAGELVDLSSYSTDQRKLWEAHIRALINYHPGSYDGPVHLFRSPGHQLICSFDRDYSWGKLVKGPVHVAVVPGVHEKILEEPWVKTVAEKLKVRLEKRDPGGDSATEEAGRPVGLRRVVFHAGLCWLGLEGAAFLEHGQPAESHGLALAMFFQQLSRMCNRSKEETHDNENGGPEPDSTVPGSDATGSSGSAHENGNGAAETSAGDDSNQKLERALTPKLSRSLSALSATEGVSLPITLMAAARVLLQRYSFPYDHEALGFGQLTPLARDGRGVTCSVHQLMLNTDLSANPTFRQVLRDLRAAAANAGIDPASEIPPGHAAVSGFTELFRAAFHLPRESGDAAGAGSREASEGRADLSLGFDRRDGELLVEVEYNPAVFEGGSVRRMLGHLQSLLEGVAANADQAIATLPMLTEAERRQLLVEWNRHDIEFPTDRPYHKHFEERVALTPDAVAARFRGKELTYAELNERANRLAHHLRSLGAGPEVLVAICLPRSLDVLISILAAFKAGSAYLPLDPTYPTERLNYMLSDSGAQVLLTRKDLLRNFTVEKAKVVCLDDAAAAERIAAQPASNPDSAATADSLAYVIYTSGSTGTPKGVQIDHRALLNHNFGAARAYGLTDADRVLQFSALSFDISVEEIFPTWLCGGAVVMRTDDVLASTHRFMQFVADERISVLDLPTAYWHELVEYLQTHDAPESLRVVIIGGEKASDEAWRRWKQRVGMRIQLFNTYGPTEATVIATLHMGRAEDHTLPIGRPVANVQTVILDPHLQLVPAGVAGELHIGGAGLSRGYLNRPELTDAKFIPNPYHEIPSTRLYKTGDVARLRPDGIIEFVGRVDEQVKIRGFRIELGEIESALCEHPGIRAATVVMREDVPGQKRLVAYVVPREGEVPGVSALRSMLKRKLPAYMVPSAFVELSALPMTPAGKVDRRSLPAPGTERPELDEQFVAPRNPVEEILAGIWAEVLGVAAVGVHDNFFDLGGHSLLATQVISRAREGLQVEIPLGDLFEFPTVGMLAERLNDPAREARPVVPVSALAKTCQLPLTPGQQRIWFLDCFDPQQSAYNLVTAFRLEGALDFSALTRSLTELARRHEALRAVFPAENGNPVQVICEPREVQAPVMDLRDVPEEEREARAREIAAVEGRKPYILSSPMLRPLLLRVGEQEHWLLLITHQLASDTRSAGVLAEELAALYGCLAEGRAPSLPPLPMNYAESLSARSLRTDAEMAQIEYWKARLAGAPPLLELPADRTRPAHQGDSGARVAIRVSAETAEALEALSRESNCSLFTALLAGFQTVLSRYTGSTDIVVGSVISTRSREELKRLVGNFENCIALRTDLSGDPSFSELLGRVKGVVEGAVANGDVAFEKVLEALRPSRNASYTPIYQVAFVFDAEPLSSRNAGGVAFRPIDIDQKTSRRDLSVRLSRTESGLTGWIEYNTDLFDAPRMERLASHLAMLWSEAARCPQETISRLNLLPETERKCLLEEWTSTARDWPAHHTIAGWFEEEARKAPGRIGLIAGTERITCGELNERANQLAHRLQQAGVGPETLVGVCMERSADMIVALLAVLKAGGGYVPLDPTYPADRLAFILEDSRAPVLLTQSSLDVLPAMPGMRTICLDAEAAGIRGLSRENPARGSGPENLAYVIYTSGSTGRPKGVAIEQRNTVAFIAWAGEVFSPAELAGVLASTSICFDLSVFEIFVPLICGGTVILGDNALALPSLPERDRVTLINTVPSAMRELLRVKGVPPSVEVINLAGEPLITPLVNQIHEQTDVRKVYDLYGPSETTTYSTFTLRRPNASATIGRPLANEKVYLLDSRMQPVPIGIPGEIYIGGAGVGRGYLNRIELTQEKFVPDPFESGSRLYRTGDLARWRADGNIEFLGRMDHQVKIRGFRIELGEVESRLRKHPAVHDAVVLAREDQPGDKRLVAYVERRPGRLVSADELRASLKEALPEYMVPAAFVIMETLPLTPNGKVDRKALPAPEQNREHAAAAFVAPRNPMEEQLAMVWREVLQLKLVGVDDNFFELGGHSLLAVQIVSRLREALKVELPLFSLFDAPTIASLAEGLSSGIWTQNQLPILPLSPAPRDRDLPVSFVQERLWFLDQLEPDSHAYNVPMALRIRGRLDPEALQRALNEIARRHESLRTRFEVRDGNVVQVIDSESQVRIEQFDLTTLPPEEREIRARALLAAEAQRPFVLAQGPLTRVLLLRIDAEEHALLVVMHHAISDGWSFTILFREWEALYGAFVSSGATARALPDLPVQYADYAHWKRQWMQGALLDQEIAWWKQKLAGAPAAIDLPADHPEPNVPGRKGGRKFVLLPKDLADGLGRLSQREGTTVFSALFTALALTLRKWTRQKDMVIGTVVAGRNRRETENVIGCFMNFLPIRTRVEDGVTGRELLASVKGEVVDAQAHQDCPFEKIVEAINPERKLNRNPLYNVALLLQNFPADLFKSDGLEVRTMPVEMEAALLDLRFEAEQTEQGISVMCEYRTDLFDSRTIEELTGSYVRMVQLLIEKPEAGLGEFEISEELKSQADAARNRPPEQMIAISATFTAEPVEESVQHWMRQLEIPAVVEFAPFNQVFQQLLDPAALFARNPAGVNVVLLRPEDWQDQPEDAPGASRLIDGASVGQNPRAVDGAEPVILTPARISSDARIGGDLEAKAREFVAAMQSSASRSGIPHLVVICPPSLPVASDAGRRAALDRVETLLAAELDRLGGVYCVTTGELMNFYPVKEYYDGAGDELGRVPYTPLFFTALGTMIARKFHALLRPSPKVIVLDCDQTLWAGVCGEDGAQGIRVDEPRRALQEFARAQHDAGRLLTVCSKNNEEDVHEVFARRNDMPLRREHFAALRLNWLPKSENIRSIAAELNLGLDSFVFVDDNPVECAEVEANCPEVLALQLPEDPETIPQFLKHCWAFDVLKVTDEDRRRSEMYRENREREQLRTRAVSLADFIEGLKLEVRIAPMADDQLARVSQLTQRTNQFNFTTIRRSEAELRKVASEQTVLAVSVTDRFGDYGLVGVMICGASSEALDVETVLLSCRVLGRGVEHQMLAFVGRMAREQGLDWVNVHFHPSAKNKPAADFIDNVGAEFKQPLNGGFIYRFPARIAEGMRFNPSQASPVQAESRPADKPRAGRIRVRKFARCRAIAVEANEIQRIHDTIEREASSTRARRRPAASAPAPGSAPRSDIERDLCRIWEKLLRVDRVEPRDNFFDLGGHSLLAVRLFAEIEKLTGRKYPLVTLFQAPTVSQLARAIGDTRQSARSPIVPVRAEGSRPPLFLVHGAGGDVLWGYANLVNHLDPDQPVYGIKSRGQIGLDEFAHIEEMARYYIQEIKTIQAEGPYYLGGYCFGGNVAYEMARQLRGAGEQVGIVALIDAQPANVGYETILWWNPAYWFRFSRNFRHWLKDFNQLPVEDRRRFFSRKIRAFGRKVMTKLSGGRVSELVDLEDVIDPAHFPAHELKLWEVHIRALVDHVERPYGGPVTLFRTNGQPLFCSLTEDFCWGRLTRGGLTLKFIPGSHENIFMEPNVQSLAASLEESLGEARARFNSEPAREDPPIPPTTNGPSGRMSNTISTGSRAAAGRESAI